VRNMVRAGIPEKQAMLISGHKTRSIFDRYDIVDERDIQDAGKKLAVYHRGEQKRLRKAQAAQPSGEVSTKISTVDLNGKTPKSSKGVTLQ
jgi:hypothetical protein